MPKVFIAPTCYDARLMVEGGQIAMSVEAEYGAYVAEGSRYTAAHHQPVGSPYAGSHIVAGGRRAPCCDEAIPALAADEIILISHIDLDTLGGCLRADPEFTDLFDAAHAEFWLAAEVVDLRGPHRVADVAQGAQDMLRAFWAWSKGPGRFADRFDARPVASSRIGDATAYVVDAGHVIRQILAGDAALLAEGEALRLAEAELDARTFVRVEGPVRVRIAHAARDFCSHLYGDSVGQVVYNAETGAITLSLAQPVAGISCRQIAQKLWGPEAGGHDGIAGSPRGRTMDIAALDAAVRCLDEAITIATYDDTAEGDDEDYADLMLGSD